MSKLKVQMESKAQKTKTFGIWILAFELLIIFSRNN